MISQLKLKKKKDTENRLVVAGGRRDGDWAKWLKVVNKFKLPVIFNA